MVLKQKLRARRNQIDFYQLEQVLCAALEEEKAPNIGEETKFQFRVDNNTSSREKQAEVPKKLIRAHQNAHFDSFN